jgi:opacity protein-like surface antigen
MKLLSQQRLTLFLISILFFSTNVSAVEITPLVGYRNGGEFVDTDTNKKHTIESSDMYGLIIGWPLDKQHDMEIYYSHQSSKLRSVNVDIPTITSTTTDIPLTVDYLHIGGTAPITNTGPVLTFVTGGLGFAYLSPDISGLQSDLRASFSIGLGMKYLFTKNIALRLETRGLATLFNSNSALFCNGGCSLSVNGSLFWQAEVFAGLGFKF